MTDDKDERIQFLEAVNDALMGERERLLDDIERYREDIQRLRAENRIVSYPPTRGSWATLTGAGAGSFPLGAYHPEAFSPGGNGAAGAESVQRGPNPYFNEVP